MKSLRLRWYGLVEIIQNQRMSTQNATATVKGTGKDEDRVKDGETRYKRT
jgi:hypothetical protein